MRTSLFHWSIIGLALTSLCLALAASEPLDSEAGEAADPAAHQAAELGADQAFDEENYRLAHRLYKQLARVGDKFSQYRLALMHERGLGIEPDLAEAYAWAILAAELGHSELVEYREGLKSRLSPTERAAGLDRMLELWEAYSAVVVARRMIRENRRMLRECTGSRLGTTCSGSIGPTHSASGQQYNLQQGTFRRFILREIEELEDFLADYRPNAGQAIIRDLEDFEGEAEEPSEASEDR